MNRLNNFSRAILAIVMILYVGFPSFAHAFKVGRVFYNYIDKEAKTVEVTYGYITGYEGHVYYSGDITIPSTVTYDGTTYSVISIGDGAFRDCYNLTSVTIPNSITSIGMLAFSNCPGLTEVNISDLSAWCKIDFHDIYSNPLYYADKLKLNGAEITNLVIPNDVTKISDYAFWDCSNLTEVTIGNSVSSIGTEAFSYCTGLTSITFPNSVTSIGEYAFRACSNLTEVTIGNSVSHVGINAFYECTGLTSIIVENSNSKYDSRDNCNAIIETASNTLISGCKNSIIPNSVTSIGERAFNKCTGLTSISIPNSVTHIGTNAFYECTGLTFLTLPNSITYIDQAAFGKCKFPVLHLPKSVTYVGLYNTCADICYCYNPTPPTGGGYTSDRLYVPKGSLTAYATAEGWKTAKQILEFDVDDIEKPILTIAYPEGGVIKQEVDNGEILKLQIVPANGWKCHSATFNSADVTNQIDANGYYNTPAITANSQLNIVFVKNDGSVANTLIDNDIKVCVTGNIVTIFGADEFSNVEIYNTAGATIYNGIDKSITLDANGIYILTVEGRTFKFSM